MEYDKRWIYGCSQTGGCSLIPVFIVQQWRLPVKIAACYLFGKVTVCEVDLPLSSNERRSGYENAAVRVVVGTLLDLEQAEFHSALRRKILLPAGLAQEPFFSHALEKALLPDVNSVLPELLCKLADQDTCVACFDGFRKQDARRVSFNLCRQCRRLFALGLEFLQQFDAELRIGDDVVDGCGCGIGSMLAYGRDDIVCNPPLEQPRLRLPRAEDKGLQAGFVDDGNVWIPAITLI